MIRRREFVAGLAALAVVGPSRAQSPSPLPRIGMLFAAAPPAVAARVNALGEGLAALGLLEGRQYAFEARYADGDLARLPALAAELVRLPVNIIVTGGSSATGPALRATRTIPIVMAQDNDPVASGFVASLARPGGNVTGFATVVPELAGKQLALLAEIVPGLSRVAVFGDSGEAGNAQSVAEAMAAAGSLKLEVAYADVRKQGGPAKLVEAAVHGRAGGVLVLASAYLFARQDELIALARKERLPAIYAHPEYVRAGGLATYGVNAIELFRRSAGYIVRILGGTSPAGLPVEQPTKFELVINMKTARALGLTIPQSVLVRADEVVQ